MPDAKIYCVQTGLGIVYALHELSSGTIWTERSEMATRQVAAEKKFRIVGEEQMSHAQLLRLMGHEPMPLRSSAAPTGTMSIKEQGSSLQNVRITNDALGGGKLAASLKEDAAPPPPVKTISIAAKYHFADEPVMEVDALVISRSKSPPVSNVFCSNGELADSLAAGAHADQALVGRIKPAGA